MEIERIIGSLFSGFMCKLYAAAMAVWLAVEVAHYIAHTFAIVSKGLGA